MNRLGKTPRRRRATHPLRVLLIVGMVGAAPLAVGWYFGHNLATRTEGRSANPVTILNTPLMSVRRAPSTLVADIASRKLRVELDAVAARVPDADCLRADAGGRVVIAKSSSKPLVPASNAKIATAAVALDVLPAETVFTTRVVGELTDGTVTGDLALVGGGDPLLVSKEYLATEKYPTTSPTFLDDLADAVKNAGVRAVTGSVVGDESLLDDARYVSEWAASIRGTEAGPLGALMVNDGVVVGESIKPDNPAVAAAREFTRLLVARGITIGGDAREAKNPVVVTDKTLVASIDSAPVGKVVAEMLTNSDNNTAEILLRQIGLARSLQPTTAGGLAVVASTLESWGIDNVTLKDGSGLSRGNRMTCASLVELLERAPRKGALRDGLAVGGRSGTLSEVFTDPSIAGRLVGKTGTLLNVKTLGAILPVGDNDDVVMALFLNGAGWADQGNYRPLWEAMAKAAATYPQAPAVAQVSVVGIG